MSGSSEERKTQHAVAGGGAGSGVQPHYSNTTETDDPLAPPKVHHVHHYDLPPTSRVHTTRVSQPHVVEHLLEVPHIECIERIEEVPHVRKVPQVVPVPRVEVVERIIEIPKYVKKEQTVEIPQTHVIDNVVEVPQVIVQQKVVEVPKMMLQERIIPIPRRTIEERIVEIPEDDFERILRERVGPRCYDPATATVGCDDGKDVSKGYVETSSVCGTPYIEAKQQLDQSIGVPLPDGRVSSRYYVTEVPDIQHMYRGITEPVYRHIPKPVEIPVTHYKPVPIEKVIDRNVPVPVELEVVQEFLCPRIEAKYYEVPVPIPVRRIVEKPVPVDAMFNSVIMDSYMNGQMPIAASCIQSCGGSAQRIPKTKMTEMELQAAGICPQPSLSQVASFKSRGPSNCGLKTDRSQNFFIQQRTLIPGEPKNSGGDMAVPT